MNIWLTILSREYDVIAQARMSCSDLVDSGAPAGERTYLLNDPGMARELMPGYSGIVPAGTREEYIHLVKTVAKLQNPSTWIAILNLSRQRNSCLCLVLQLAQLGILGLVHRFSVYRSNVKEAQTPNAIHPFEA